MKESAKLFTPAKIGSMTVKNRVVMAPMATDFADGDGSVAMGAMTALFFTVMDPILAGVKSGP